MADYEKILSDKKTNLGRIFIPLILSGLIPLKDPLPAKASGEIQTQHTVKQIPPSEYNSFAKTLLDLKTYGNVMSTITMSKEYVWYQYETYSRGSMSEVDKVGYETALKILETYGYKFTITKNDNGETVKSFTLNTNFETIKSIATENTRYLKEKLNFTDDQIQKLQKLTPLHDIALTIARENQLNVNLAQLFVLAKTLQTYPQRGDNLPKADTSKNTADANTFDCIRNTLALMIARYYKNNLNTALEKIKEQIILLDQTSYNKDYPNKSESKVFTDDERKNWWFPGFVYEMSKFGYTLDEKTYSFEEYKQLINERKLPDGTMIFITNLGNLNFHALTLFSTLDGQTFASSQVDGGMTPFIPNNIVTAKLVIADLENNPDTKPDKNTTVYILRPN